jgi:hypothetical protein
VYKIKLSSKEAEKLEVVNFKDSEQKEFDIPTLPITLLAIVGQQ